MIKSLSSLRFVLPAMICAFAVLLVIVSFYSGHANLLNKTDLLQQQNMHQRLVFLQGASKQFFQLNRPDQLRSMVGNMAADRDLITIVVVTADDEVVASNASIEVGRNWRSLAVQPDLRHIEDVLSRRSVATILDRANGDLDGYSSFCVDSDRRLGREDCGFIFYRINIAYHYAKAVQVLQAQAVFIIAGVAVGVVGLLILIHLLVTSRVERVVAVLQRYTGGDRRARCAMRGYDELGFMGLTVDQLLTTVEIDEKLIFEKEERLETLFQTVADSIITIDHCGIILRANKATEMLFGYPANELEGQNISMLMPAEDAQQHDHHLQHYQGKDHSFVIGVGRDLMGQKKDGKVFPIELTVTEMSHQGERMFTGIIRDITERKQLQASLVSANKKLLITAHTDSLTQLANRRQFDLTIVNELGRATRTARPLSLLLCDIDHFKSYNDSFGHVAGDECLQQVAGVMRKLFARSSDLSCRYGGEEFAIILADDSALNAEEMAKLLLQKIADLHLLSAEVSQHKYVTISIGYATYWPCSSVPLSPHDFINYADEALYKAKATGRNRVEGGIVSVSTLAKQ